MTTFRRTNDFIRYKPAKIKEWLDGEALGLFEDEKGVVILCHEEDAAAVERRLNNARLDMTEDVAQSLMLDSENIEYNRALCELVAELRGLSLGDGGADTVAAEYKVPIRKKQKAKT